MLPHGMRHSKEDDAKLAQDTLQRAYADPASFQIEGKKDARPAYLPEDIDQYTWLLQGKYIRRAVGYVVLIGFLAGCWWSVSAFTAWYKEQQQFYKANPQKCDGSVASYFCAEKDMLNKGTFDTAK